MQPSTYLKNLDSTIAAVCGFIAIYIYTKYSGVGISPDSIMYASTAHNIAFNGSLLTFTKTPLVFFPVFYPFFLAVILFITRVDTFVAAPYINGVLFAILVFVSGWLISKFRSRSPIYKWLILIAIILSPALLEIYTFLWSETLFTLLALLFVVAFRQYQKDHTIRNLIIAAVVAAIGCITRYAGVTIIGTGGLLILLDNELLIRKKLIHLFSFGFLSISLLVGNLILNSLSTGLSTGTREPSITPFSENLHYFGTVMCDWLGLPESYDIVATSIGALLLSILIGLLLWKILSGKLNNTENIFITYALVYGLFIVITASISRFERINSRLLSPMFLFLLVGLTSWAPDMLNNLRQHIKIALAVPFIAVMLLFEYVTAQTDYQRYDDEIDYGVPGYSDDSWNTSDFVVFLRSHKHIYKPNVPIYSDANEAVYLFSGMSSSLLPHKFFKHDVAQFYAEKHYYLIWFKELGNTEILNLDDIQKVEHLKKLYDLKDGAVYEYNSQ